MNLSNFNSANMPMTDSKKDAVVELLSQYEKFLKFQYVLKDRSIKCKLIDLHREYEQYVTSNSPDYRCDSLIEFKNNMKNLGLHHKAISGYDCYFNRIKSHCRKKTLVTSFR